MSKVFYDAYGRKIATEDAEDTRTVGANASGTTGGLGLMDTFDLDAAGNVVAKNFTDGGVTSTTYDQFGHALSQTQLVASGIAPSIQYQYDRAGRLVVQSQGGVQYSAYVYDTLGNRLQTQVWGDYVSPSNTAGDGGITKTVTLHDYDAFGHALDSLVNNYTNIGGVSTLFAGTTTASAAGISFFYNGNGQTQSQTYDIWSNVIATRDNAGDLITDTYDAFGHVLTSTDLAGVVTTYTYDGLGHLLTQNTFNSPIQRALTNSAGNSDNVTQVLNFHYDAAGRLSSSSDTSSDAVYSTSGAILSAATTYQVNHTENYTTDAFGRQVFRSVSNNGTAPGASATVLTTTTTYDALGRTASITDEQGEGVSYVYDANSNVRAAFSWYLTPNYVGPGVQMQQDDRWFTYDSQNRVLISEGRLEPATTGSSAAPAYVAIDTAHLEMVYQQNVAGGSGGSLVTTQDATGTQLSYDLAGRRASSVTFVGSNRQYQRFTYNQGSHEIASVSTSSSATGTYNLSEQRTYNGYGQLVQDFTYNGSGVLTQWATNTYDGAGRLVQQQTFGANGELTGTNLTRFDVLGNAIQTAAQTINTSDDQTSISYMVYTLFGSEMLTTTSNTTVDNAAGTSLANDSMLYNTEGQVIFENNSSSSSANNRGFVVDMAGQIEEKTANHGTQRYLVVANTVRASFGNLDPVDVDENDAAANISAVSATPGTVVSQSGDTLKSLALSLLGDSGLWYVLADANGLNTDPDTALSAGTVLAIPNTLAQVHNNATTVVPYNPASIIGNTAPTLNFPPPKTCPLALQIVGVIVMVVAACFGQAEISGPIMAAFAAAAAAAAANAAIQIYATGHGYQKSFSYSEMAMAAASAAVGSAASGMGNIGLDGNAIGASATAQTAVDNATAASAGSASAEASTDAGTTAVTGVSDTPQTAINNAYQANGDAIPSDTGASGSVSSSEPDYVQAYGHGGIPTTSTSAAPSGLPSLGNMFLRGFAGDVSHQILNMTFGHQKSFNWGEVAAATLLAPMTQAIQSGMQSAALDPNGALSSLPDFVKQTITTTTNVLMNTGISLLSPEASKLSWESVAAEAIGTSLGNEINAEVTINGSAFQQLKKEDPERATLEENYLRSTGGSTLADANKVGMNWVNAQADAALNLLDTQGYFFASGGAGLLRPIEY